jgi:GTP cyclohydrolase II
MTPELQTSDIHPSPGNDHKGMAIEISEAPGPAASRRLRAAPIGALTKVAEVNFPTRWAQFRLLGFNAARTAGTMAGDRLETALALVLGELPHLRSTSPLVRIHSQCTTGDVFHSLRCDCHDQLHLALEAIADQKGGILIYELQEGRGIGLLEKLRAYELQDRGFDTVEANLRLGHAVDLRDYALAAGILHSLGIRSVRLMTDNPEKIEAVLAAGIRVTERVSAWVLPGPDNSRYLATKQEKLGHFKPGVQADSSLAAKQPSLMASYEGMTLT